MTFQSCPPFTFTPPMDNRAKPLNEPRNGRANCPCQRISKIKIPALILDTPPKKGYLPFHHYQCGEMAEWLKVHAWKACVLKGTESSNLSLSATLIPHPGKHVLSRISPQIQTPDFSRCYWSDPRYPDVVQCYFVRSSGPRYLIFRAPGYRQDQYCQNPCQGHELR